MKWNLRAHHDFGKLWVISTKYKRFESPPCVSVGIQCVFSWCCYEKMTNQQLYALQMAAKRKRNVLLSWGMPRELRKSFSLVPGSSSFQAWVDCVSWQINYNSFPDSWTDHTLNKDRFSMSSTIIITSKTDHMLTYMIFSSTKISFSGKDIIPHTLVYKELFLIF